MVLRNHHVGAPQCWVAPVSLGRSLGRSWAVNESFADASLSGQFLAEREQPLGVRPALAEEPGGWVPNKGYSFKPPQGGTSRHTDFLQFLVISNRIPTELLHVRDYYYFIIIEKSLLNH